MALEKHSINDLAKGPRRGEDNLFVMDRWRVRYLRFRSSGQINQNDNSQIGDDLVLLWIILSKKAREILGQKFVPIPTEDDRFDLEAILPILLRLEEILFFGRRSDRTI
jgi:hypothetical protein